MRWGGDEFFIAGRHASRAGAEIFAERIRVELASHRYQVGDGQFVRLTASIGLTMFPFMPARPHFLSWEQAVRIADQAAYLAKENGRDAWVGLYGNPKTPSEDLYAQLSDNLEELIEQGMVELMSSINRPLMMSNRIHQKRV